MYVQYLFLRISITSMYPEDVIYLCPTMPKGSCQWEGSAPDILEHFQNSHKDLLMDSNIIRADVTQNAEHNRLMPFKAGLFLLQTKYRAETAKLSIRLRLLGSQEKAFETSYSAEVVCGDFGFTNSSCSEEYNPVFNVDGGVEVDIQAISLMSCVRRVEYVTVKINVNDQPRPLISERGAPEAGELVEQTVARDSINSSKEESVISDDQEDGSDKEVSWAIREEDKSGFAQQMQDNIWELKNIKKAFDEGEDDEIIKCTSCHHNMIPPIYMCPDGHSVCYVCKYSNCRICGQEITELRNIDLEEHSKNVAFPCRYGIYGCKERHKYDQIRRHEIHCDFCVYKCELCVFEGKLNEIRSHFRIAHPSAKIYETMAGIRFPRGSNFVVINSNGVFYCTSRATETYVEWKVVFCGPKERYFSCEVRITGKKQSSPKHYFLKRKDNVFAWTVPFDELKVANIKEKNSMLFISSY